MRQNTKVVGTPAAFLALQDQARNGKSSKLASIQLGELKVQARESADSVLLIAQNGRGPGVVLRVAHCFGAKPAARAKVDQGRMRIDVKWPGGAYRVDVRAMEGETPMLRCTQQLTPNQDLLVSRWPKDLFPLGDGSSAGGEVLATQRGLNCPVVFFSIAGEPPTTCFYFQNLTALNEYFDLTGTSPDGAVDGHWPELGYAPPGNPVQPLPAGKTVTISDAFLLISHEASKNPQGWAEHFLQMLAEVYLHLDRPQTEFRDWPKLAKSTLRDLETSHKAVAREYEHKYLHPYVDSEYPDSMVQLAVLAPLSEYGEWSGENIPLIEELAAGLDRFVDPRLGTIRRYLPSVGKDKDRDAVDSWYAYHPLSNMAWLAQRGSQEAARLLEKCMEYAIKTAQHFDYEWPIQYKIDSFEVIQDTRKPSEPGQSDTGGIYAYLMTQAWELTKDDRFLEEARRALRALSKMRFDLEYQANIVAFGAAACTRMFAITGDPYYKQQRKVFLAGFFHNCILWESELKLAKDYSVFMGASCLHDAAYMAIFECSDSFVAFHQMLGEEHGGLDDSERLLLSEYCRHTLHRAWFYYPENLPKRALAKEIRNGHLDPSLSFPLEDLYPSGEPAGSVGQEIYGCGAAFLFACRAFQNVPDAPFLLFAEYTIRDLAVGERSLETSLAGSPLMKARVRLIPKGRKPLPKLTIRAARSRARAQETPEGHVEFFVPGDGSFRIEW